VKATDTKRVAERDNYERELAKFQATASSSCDAGDLVPDQAIAKLIQEQGQRQLGRAQQVSPLRPYMMEQASPSRKRFSRLNPPSS
jgi:hypothetical protein